MKLFAALTLSLACTVASAAEPTAIAIKAGKLVDVVAGRVVSDQVIVVRGETIEAVGASASVKIPAGAQVIDLSGSTVLPGLIDVHTHLISDPTLPPYHGYGLSYPRVA